MATIYESHTIKSEGVYALDLLVWERFHARKDGLVERILELPQNYGLAELMPILPVGTVVVIPIDEETASGVIATETISLWT